MVSCVPASRNDLKILWSVIGWITVNVMHYFIVTKRAPKRFSCDESITQRMCAAEESSLWISRAINHRSTIDS